MSHILTVPRRFNAGFFILGLLNNVLYVIILSAALDLVSGAVPKGVILFANITPALLVKVGWPYLVHGQVHYARRVLACSAISFAGMAIVASFPSITLRLIGIAAASFSSGLGEMTYLQLSTSYGDDRLCGIAVSWFASGTGAAGLFGAGLWWFLRGLGVKTGLGISTLLPLCMAAGYFSLLPSRVVIADFCQSVRDTPESAYAAVPSADPFEAARTWSSGDAEHSSEGASEGDEHESRACDRRSLRPTSVHSGDASADAAHNFTLREKLDVARPMIWPYMVPLFLVYCAEYTINTGVSPTLIYPIPSSTPILAHVIKSLRDYYPLWQLTYQTFVFLSRSSIAIFGMPPVPKRLLFAPSIIQCLLLVGVASESSRGWLESGLNRVSGSGLVVVAVFCLIAAEGLSGGLSYVSVYSHIGMETPVAITPVAIDDQAADDKDVQLLLARREFQMGCAGFADTLGILVASLISSWLEFYLCQLQESRGKTPLCRDV